MVLKSQGDFKTLVTTPGASMLAPAALWLLDDTFRLKNLGSKGAAMDLQVRGSELDENQGLYWNARGPRDSRATYLRYPGKLSNDFDCWFTLQQNGEYLVDFSLGFTITLWLKIEGPGARYIIDRKTLGADLWFDPDRDQLGMSHKGHWVKEHSRTIKNSQWINEWRHIAVSYTGTGTPTFYLNGQLWTIAEKSTAKMVTTDWTYMFRGHSTVPDSKACFMIFQENLSMLEINAIMNNCP